MQAAVILQCEGVSKHFKSGDGEVTALQDISFVLKKGETCAVLGPSGSGKTTLLTLAAGLDRPSAGKVVLAGKNLADLDEDQLALVRGKSVGFVFQNYQLLPSLTALENVLLPLEIRGKQSRAEALALLGRVGLGARLHHYPAQLSGGEQQRVALARAFINKPEILFADEPTGSLDRDSAERALEAMFELNREHAASMLLVTHDSELASRLERRVVLKNGRLVSHV